MCGRFALSAPARLIAEQFNVDDVVADDVPARFNIAPSTSVLVVASSADGTKRRLGALRWGLVPSWADDPAIGARLANARAETAHTKPAFRNAFARHRCLVPASGYYEWQDAAGSGNKIPYYFARADGLLLAIGGLWEVWHGPGGETLRTCTVLTTDANKTAAAVHDRMPVLVPERLWDQWLAPRPLTEDERLSAIAPAPSNALTVVRVASAVNDPRHDGPDLVEPVPDRDRS